MDLFDAIEKRRSVRQFAPGDVPDADLLKILEAGRLAPSGCNIQDREFLLIRNPDTIRKLNEIQPIFNNVPAVIAVVMSPTKTPYGGTYWVEDCAASVENMLLAITALGYGSVWVEGTLLRREEWAKQLLGVPDDKRLYVLLPVGHPAATAASPAKKPLEQIVHHESFGTQHRGTSS